MRTQDIVGRVESRIFMNTVVTIELDGTFVAPACEERLERAFGWFGEMERCCSRFDAESELRKVCDRVGGGVVVSPLLFAAIDFALAVAKASGGAFDPTVGVPMVQRGFDQNYLTGQRTPEPKEAAKASYRDVLLSRETTSVTLLHPLLLDLGAVAKGMAVDLAAAELSMLGGFIINAGGDVLVGGDGPREVGIKHSAMPGRLLTILHIAEGAVCTSGGYERPAATGGHHIIDPRTGSPALSAASMTVVAPSAMLADAIATAAFVLGPEQGLRFAAEQGVEALCVDAAGNSTATIGLERYQR